VIAVCVCLNPPESDKEWFHPTDAIEKDQIRQAAKMPPMSGASNDLVPPARFAAGEAGMKASFGRTATASLAR